MKDIKKELDKWERDTYFIKMLFVIVTTLCLCVSVSVMGMSIYGIIDGLRASVTVVICFFIMIGFSYLTSIAMRRL